MFCCFFQPRNNLWGYCILKQLPWISINKIITLLEAENKCRIALQFHFFWRKIVIWCNQQTSAKLSITKILTVFSLVSWPWCDLIEQRIHLKKLLCRNNWNFDNLLLLHCVLNLIHDNMHRYMLQNKAETDLYKQNFVADDILLLLLHIIIIIIFFFFLRK